MSVPKPSPAEVARALLAVGNADSIEMDVRQLLAGVLLPHMAQKRALSVVLEIRSYQLQARGTGSVTVKQARAWFCDNECDHPPTDEAVLVCLARRAEIWQGEAATIALRAALDDAAAIQTRGGTWVVPGMSA